jgi:ATP-dependent HslUV protease subunit HslV
MLIALDKTSTFLVSGNGDLIEPDDGFIAIGSGGAYALAAAKALARHTTLDARQIAAEAMSIAAGICIYSNDKITIESL